MKNLALILSLVLAVLASCTRPAPSVPTPEAPRHDTLAAYDSLMQSQPDSALYALLDFNSTHKNLTPFDRHYAALLLSEALFKNDYEQSLRAEVQQAQTYFDSLAAAHPRNDDYTLLSARSYYMNGVGFMEADSVVEACTEYLKALEIMNEHFDEDELTGYKAKFMALTYNRLGDLFSDQYMTEQAIFCLKESLSLFDGEGSYMTVSYLGLHYEMANKNDSAIYYYDKALKQLPDTNCLLYRDIVSDKAYIEFFSGGDQTTVLDDLKRMKEKADDDKEIITRSFAIGCIYFRIRQYDSAVVYLKTVFNDSTDYQRQLQVADYLGKIYDSIGEPEESEKFSHFLAEHTMSEYGKRNVASKLNNLLQQYLQQKQERVASQKRLFALKWSIIIVCALIIIALFFNIIIRYKAKKDIVNQKKKAYEIQKSLSGRLKSSTENLKQEKEKTKSLQKELETIQQQKTWDSLEVFLEEDICKEILASVEGKAFKREMEKSDYQDIILNNSQLARLSTAVEKHFSGFRKMLADKYPKMDENEFNLCYLYLLNLNDLQISALLNLGYSSLKKRVSKLKKAFKTEKELLRYICDMVM